MDNKIIIPPEGEAIAIEAQSAQDVAVYMAHAIKYLADLQKVARFQ